MKSEFLDPIETEEEPRPFVVFDIESKRDDTQEKGFTRPFMVGFYDGEEFTAFRNDPGLDDVAWYDRAITEGGCIDKFLKHVLSEKYRDHDIYAHNAGAFDALFLPSWLQRHTKRYTMKVLPVQARIMMIECWLYNSRRKRETEKDRQKADKKDRKKSGLWRFLDSYKVMPISLDKVIKMFGLGEGKFDMDLDAEEHDPRWQAYNEDDCKKLWQAIDRYQALIRNMGGGVGITAPSTAMRLLRMRYLHGETQIYRNVCFPDCTDTECNGCAHGFFRSAYHGGRTEIYRQSGKNLTYYDINSSYPASMKEPQPVGEMTVLGENQDFRDFVRSHVGFIRCTVHIPEGTYLPPLPLPMEDKLKFPVGKFSGTWDYAELANIFRIGGKILHIEKSVWVKASKFMVPFVDSLYAMRQKKSPDYDEGRSEVAKIMMNSTFGKFGMEHDRLEIVILKPNESIPTTTRSPKESRTSHKKRLILPVIDEAQSGIFEHASLVRYRDIRIDAPYIIPQIAAHITALSRNLIWKYMMDILDRGGKIYYSDTDSILTDVDDIPDETNLGGLKREFEGEKIDLFCYAPKMYYLAKSDPNGKPFAGEHQRDKHGQRTCDKKCKGCGRSKIMMKGVPKDLKTEKTLKQLREGLEIVFEQHEKLGALARRDFMDTPRMVTVRKSLKSKYDKRLFIEGDLTKVANWSDFSKGKSPDGPEGDTRAIVASPHYLSDAWKQLGSRYQAPAWLEELRAKS